MLKLMSLFSGIALITAVSSTHGDSNSVESVSPPLVFTTNGNSISLKQAELKCRNCPSPQYSYDARKRRLEGAVILRVFIKENGGVGEVKVKQSSGHQTLDVSAAKAVQDWQFYPFQATNHLGGAVVDIPIAFELVRRQHIEAPEGFTCAYCPVPDFPQGGPKLNESATVVVRIGFGGSGAMETMSVKESSGFPALDDAALRAVKSWKIQMKPGRVASTNLSLEVPLVFLPQPLPPNSQRR